MGGSQKLVKVYGISGGGGHTAAEDNNNSNSNNSSSNSNNSSNNNNRKCRGSAEEVQRKCRPLTRDAIDFRPSPESALKLQLTLQA